VVTRDVPDYALMIGNPARQVGWMCQCGERLYDDLTCPSCGAVYEEHDGRLSVKSALA
jgi:UDP-2-acetamido-3-amino-2,3-dideoxy-glucuronate N-acetyltransferase